MLNKKKDLGSFADPAPSIHISAQHQPSPPQKKNASYSFAIILF